MVDPPQWLPEGVPVKSASVQMWRSMTLSLRSEIPGRSTQTNTPVPTLRSGDQHPNFHILPAQKSRPVVPRTHVQTATTVGRCPLGVPSPPFVRPAHALGGTPNTAFPSTVARQSRKPANDDLNKAAMLWFRCSHQESEAQSVPNDRIILAYVWLQRSRASRIGVGVNAVPEEPVIRYRNPC